MRLQLAICGVAFVGLAAEGSSADGQVATYNYGMTEWVESPDGSTIYATVPSLNSIAVINANTLQSTLVGIGSNPQGLALSQDGSTLYVADQGSNFIGVLNTKTDTTLSPIPLGPGVNPLDVQVGNNNRLWVLAGAQNQFASIIQVSATTGASTGPSPSASLIYGGKILANSDGSALYYGDFGTSPSYQNKFDVGATNPITDWSDSLGFNGEDVALSRDGTLVVFPQGGNALNGIIQTSTNLTLGSVGPATNVAFSPDNEFAYTSVFFNQGISIYSLSTFLQVGTINTVGGPHTLFVDDTGQYIFSNEVGDTEVYATGRTVLQPTFTWNNAGGTGDGKTWDVGITNPATIYLTSPSVACLM